MEENQAGFLFRVWPGLAVPGWLPGRAGRLRLLVLAALLCVPSMHGLADDDVPLVAPVDLATLSLDLFSDADLATARQTPFGMPFYLAHLSTLANSVETAGETPGWIGRRVWRSMQEFRGRSPRIMENVLSLAYFHCRERAWNRYRGDPALRQRLELALEYYLSRLGDDGLMLLAVPEERPGLRLANTMFFTKFMGETLVLLHGGPPIAEPLHARLVDAQRRALTFLLQSDAALEQGRRFSNQYGNTFAGAYAYLSVQDDPALRTLLLERIPHIAPQLQSPAGYFYENHSADFGYSLGTHHSNLQMAWHYAEKTGMETDWLARETSAWAEWLAYNAVPEPDWSFFALNRAIELRQSLAGFVDIAAPFARQVPGLRPFVAAAEEVAEEQRLTRAAAAAEWPAVPPLVGSFSAYSPYAFLHRDHTVWHPTKEARQVARARLPYLARDRFVHQRVDDRQRLEATFIRRPGYYAIFNAGEQQSRVQTFGLGLLWHPTAGTALQSQTRLPQGAWGVRPAAAERVAENAPLAVHYQIGADTITPQPGPSDLPEGYLTIRYPIGATGTKTLRFEEDHLRVEIQLPGDFAEQIPLLLGDGPLPELAGARAVVPCGGANLLVEGEGVRAWRWVETDRAVGAKTVRTLVLEGAERLAYTLRFAPRPDQP